MRGTHTGGSTGAYAMARYDVQATVGAVYRRSVDRGWSVGGWRRMSVACGAECSHISTETQFVGTVGPFTPPFL